MTTVHIAIMLLSTLAFMERVNSQLTPQDICYNGGTLGGCSCSCNENYWGVNCEKSILTGGCEDLTKRGIKTSGVYEMTIEGRNTFIYCDLCLDTGYPWMVVSRRINGMLSFYQTWATYVTGFGNPDEEFFIGLRNLATLTATERYVLRFELSQSPGVIAWAEYDNFKIGNETSKFPLESIGEYSGNAGDSLSYNTGMKFSTNDQDNDLWTSNCASSSYCYGPWWHRACTQTSVFGHYGNNAAYGTICGKGINWFAWTGYTVSLRQAVMMIRPYRLSHPDSVIATTTATNSTTS